MRALVAAAWLALAQGDCTTNADCSSGFCNADEPAECEACYYPGDLSSGDDACARFEDACGAACDGSGGSSGDDSEEEEDGADEGADVTVPDDCCSEVMSPHMECVYPTDATYSRTSPTAPVISSVAEEFETSDDCAAHDAYTDCVGETGERCQWVFLSSPRGGFCRVDPISKSLGIQRPRPLRRNPRAAQRRCRRRRPRRRRRRRRPQFRRATRRRRPWSRPRPSRP